ncbi:hypothetical protein CDAR_561481 [Caerostris darwini]|uniref:Uncharacterized protein n=1 Tax=Caerostris darwini TaxID=1538125 RepID=A0AAV4QRR1_9ARAC|nr:hypothetical protein CDAR_561481 [Caerostris darwini]
MVKSFILRAANTGVDQVAGRREGRYNSGQYIDSIWDSGDDQWISPMQPFPADPPSPTIKGWLDDSFGYISIALSVSICSRIFDVDIFL